LDDVLSKQGDQRICSDGDKIDTASIEDIEAPCKEADELKSEGAALQRQLTELDKVKK